MRRRNEQGGQTLVEFALVLPLLLMILFAICQYGFLFYTYISVNQAAREGARHAAVGAADAAIVTKITATVALDPAMLAIAITPAERISGEEVTVSVSVAKANLLILPFVGSYLPDNLVGKVVMRVEKDYSP